MIGCSPCVSGWFGFVGDFHDGVTPISVPAQPAHQGSGLSPQPSWREKPRNEMNTTDKGDRETLQCTIHTVAVTENSNSELCSNIGN